MEIWICQFYFLHCKLGHSSPVLTRSHIAVAGHKKKRSVSNLEAETKTGREYDITKILSRRLFCPAFISHFLLTITFRIVAYESGYVIKVQMENS